MIQRKRLERRTPQPNWVDIKGRRFGLWTALNFAGRRKFPGGQLHPIWRCQCDCGKVQDIIKTQLTTGASRGCKTCLRNRKLKRTDLTGKTIGGWLVVDRDNRYPSLYRARHSCGHERRLDHRQLTSPTKLKCVRCKFRAAVSGISGRIRQRRMDLGLTLEDVAVHLGVTRQCIAYMEAKPDSYWSPARKKRITTALEALR